MEKKLVDSLTKEDQAELSWRWHLDPNLQLIYKSFENYVRIVTNNRGLLHGG